MAGKSLGGQGGKALEEMRAVMKHWSVTEDDLLFLRHSLGVRAEEADVDYIPTEIVEAYKETRYAKAIAAKSAAGKQSAGKRKKEWDDRPYTHICTRCTRQVYLKQKPDSRSGPRTTSSAHVCNGKNGRSTPMKELRLIQGGSLFRPPHG